MPRVSKREVNSAERKRAVAKEKLQQIHNERVAAEMTAKRKRMAEFRGMLKAYEYGLTYTEIAAITDRSQIRVSQVLKEQRDNRASGAA